MKPCSCWFAALLALSLAAHAQTNVQCSKAIDPADATYTIDGDTVALVKGMRSVPAQPGSHTTHETRLIGAQTCGEFDGEEVAVVLLSDDRGGSGTYYYVAAVPKSGHSYPAALLGDRILPKSVAIEKGLIAVTYLDRPANAPMAAPPSVKMVRRFGLQHGHLLDQP